MPSSSSNGSSSQPRQSTLLGFFGKPKPGPAPSSRPTSTVSSTPAKATGALQSNGCQQQGAAHSPQLTGTSSSATLDTPPPSTHRATKDARSTPSAGCSASRVEESSSPLKAKGSTGSANGTGVLSVSKSTGNMSRRTSAAAQEMTPPSSSPPARDEAENDDYDEAITRPSRRRTSAKRAVNYIESDDEMQGVIADDDDDGEDRYSPEQERPSKKAKRRSSVSDDDDFGDDFDDVDLPDEAELEAIERKALARKGQNAKPTPKTMAKPSVSASASKPSSSYTMTRPPVRKSLSASEGIKGTGSTEEPYDFLVNLLDENRNPPTHPDYDKRTIFIPERAMNKLTPFEKQFWAIKKKYNDVVLFFQKGKFYELYENDAVIAHNEFGLKMTDRVRMKMAGVPESSFIMFVNKFLALGHKVGRVDQCETAVGMSMRKGGTMVGKGTPTANGDDNKIVRRELKCIYTNGTTVDPDCLPDELSTYSLSIKEVIKDPVTGFAAADKDDESLAMVPVFGLCFLDASVAQFKMRCFEDDVSRTRFETLLHSMRIKEVIHEKGGLSKRTMRILRNALPSDCNITMLKPHIEFYDEEQTLRKLNLVFNPAYQAEPGAKQPALNTVDPVDPAILPEGIRQHLEEPEALSALGGMLNYITQLNLEKDICASRNFDIFDPATLQSVMLLDAQSLGHLNVLINEQGDTEGTLLKLVNRATTPFGKRLMRIWLLSPLAKLDAILGRQEAVDLLLRNTSFQEDFDLFARSLPDIERVLPRVSSGNCKSRDFARVLKALCSVDENVTLLEEEAGRFESDIIQKLLQSIPGVSEAAREIQGMYKDESFEPRAGCDDGYDEADEAVAAVERKLQKELIRAAEMLKLSRDQVKFKDVGTNEIYQIEVPLKTKVPMGWALVSQTQKNKRYYSQEVRQLVKQLKEGRETRTAALKEFQARLYERFHEHRDSFLLAVKGIAEMDCLVSLAKASHAMGEPSCRPEFIESETALLDFTDLRHPCMANASTTEFIANDIALGSREGKEEEGAARVTILTGGNMAGKSTTARTTATAVILAQLGCHVPARSARLSAVDRIASRMGANDQLFRNNSTFMVEMLEASRILKECTPRSLVIMDELGRGTSTFDGQAIAYAVLHHLIGRTRCLCFFLTHYTALAHEFEGRFGVANRHMQVLVDNAKREVVFTYRLVDGIAESSYGTEVAALAGIPLEICDRAVKISREFAASTKVSEAERSRKLGNALNVAALSDFALLFKSGSEASIEKGGRSAARSGQVDMDGQALAFLRKQIATVVESRRQADSSAPMEVDEGGLQPQSEPIRA